MNRKILILASLLLLVSPLLFAGRSQFDIIPKPMKLEAGKGMFTFKENTAVLTDINNQELRQLGKLLVQKVADAGGPVLRLSATLGKTIPKNSVVLAIGGLSSSLPDEGYELAVTKKNIVIRANTGKGLFYGLQSLFQLFPASIEAKGTGNTAVFSLPAVKITDEPRYAYRGMHLDVCRHIFPVETIKTYLDLMAMYKMNTFHWHLTDDQGWRIEIKKYPELTHIGSIRKGTQIGRTGEHDGVPYGGFYTQEQVRDIVAYAASLYITVIPEIEMPGHAVAALSAYPQYSCTGGPFEVRTQWGISDDIFCAGNDEVFGFVQDILTEVIDLFPSKYIHVGS
ncbi:MAG TPA: family 20 glycosylhydrolase, partial [Bacteroidales bacterium]|nr:family 20 glycosylhydrolase [Bacteroidales bacterium]